MFQVFKKVHQIFIVGALIVLFIFVSEQHLTTKVGSPIIIHDYSRNWLYDRKPLRQGEGGANTSELVQTNNIDVFLHIVPPITVHM